MSSIFKASALIAIFFGINKLAALLRQGIIAREFGLSSEIDAFNIANNLPDLVFSLFSGGALALAFIPVFAEYLSVYGQKESWKLFSKTASIIFLITTVLAILFGVFAHPLVVSEFGVAPGFSGAQQELVVALMRINLIAMIIFSLSGMVMASLQANKHFLLPALAPILYNLGQIIGALILAPTEGVTIGVLTLPAFGFGVSGLAYGVVLGALLHLAIQAPGLLAFKFRYTLSFDLWDEGMRKIFRLMLPRIATVFLIQIIFLSRDNLASRLGEGAVSALTYGYFILQVPETLIGTAIATALLPSLSEFVTKGEKSEFVQTLNKAIRVIVALTLIVTVISLLTVHIFIGEIFRLDPAKLRLLTQTTNAFLLGLTVHSLLEILVRAFYARQNAIMPLFATLIRAVVFLVLSVMLFSSVGVVGIALIDSFAVFIEVGLLVFFLRKTYSGIITVHGTVIRTLIACIVSGVTIYGVFLLLPTTLFLKACIGAILGGLLALPFISKELRMIVKL